MLTAKLNAQLVLGQNQAGLATLQSLRDVQEKPDARATTGVIEGCVLHARIASGANQGPGYEQAFAKQFAAEVNALSWSVVQDTMKQMKSDFEILSPSVLEGNLKARIDPTVLQTKSVDYGGAGTLIFFRLTADIEIPLQPQIEPVVTAYIAAHNVQKPDIWQAREVTLGEDQKLTPVLIGIWDSGVDTSIYPKQLYTDPSPGAHSPHGLAFDVHGDLYNADLQPLTEAQRAF